MFTYCWSGGTPSITHARQSCKTYHSWFVMGGVEARALSDSPPFVMSVLLMLYVLLFVGILNPHVQNYFTDPTRTFHSQVIVALSRIRAALEVREKFVYFQQGACCYNHLLLFGGENSLRARGPGFQVPLKTTRQSFHVCIALNPVQTIPTRQKGSMAVFLSRSLPKREGDTIKLQPVTTSFQEVGCILRSAFLFMVGRGG